MRGGMFLVRGALHLQAASYVAGTMWVTDAGLYNCTAATVTQGSSVVVFDTTSRLVNLGPSVQTSGGTIQLYNTNLPAPVVPFYVTSGVLDLGNYNFSLPYLTQVQQSSLLALHH
jgi:hypothetical protein